MPLAEAVSASSLLFYWQAQYQGHCGQSFHDVKAVLVCQLRFDTCFCRAASAQLFLHLHLPAPSAELFLHLRQKFGSRQIRRKFGKFGKSSADSVKVRQIRQKFGRFGESSADSAKVRQIRQKFGRFGKSSAAVSYTHLTLPTKRIV